MKAYNDFKTEKIQAKEQLPVGAYVAKILNAEEVNYDWGSYLVLSFDIAEGTYKDYYKNEYTANTNENKKWKGTLRLRFPVDDGTEQDNWSKRTFNNFIYAVEDANKGYKWAWDEKTLKNKLVGIVFRNEEWEYENRRGWRTAACGIATVADVHEGKVKPAKDKPLPKKTEDFGAFTSDVEDDELPF